ncbi:hypothetical protein T484DRAFT_1757752 [Baffinella frigidus]|nr:hypothetical protein T484DRAFT_1757752 [Cryptophyta sp. CCMP2293]
MQTQPTNETVQQEGVQILYYMKTYYEDTRRFLRCGGVEVLLDAMRLNSSDGYTQEVAMAMLLEAAVAYQDSHIRDDITSAIISKDGYYLQAVLTAMRVHIDNLEVQKNGVHLLHRLMVAPISDAVITAATDAAITAGGVPAVVEAMNAHVGNEFLERVCFDILRAWVKRDGATRVLVWKHGGVVPVIRVMRHTHTAESYILRTGCKILGWITRGAPHIAEEVALQGGVSAVAHAGPFLRPFEDEAEWTLDEIATTNVGVGAIVAQGGVHLLISRMQMWVDNKHIGTTWVRVRSCEALARVASTQGGMDKIVQEGGISLILDVMRGCVLLQCKGHVSQFDKNKLQTAACNLLAKFADREDVNMCIIDNGVSVLRDVQEDSHGDEEVALAVTKVLRRVHDTRARIIEKKISFAKGIHREGTLPGALKPDIMQKIMGFVEHGTSVRQSRAPRPGTFAALSDNFATPNRFNN